MALLTLFLKIFSKTFFYVLGEDPRKILVQTEFRYLLWFLRKSHITTRYTVNIEVYMLSWFHFWSNLKNSFFHLIEYALRSLLAFKYLWLFLRKSKITAGDTLNSRLSIYVPKKVLVKKDVIYIKNCSRARLNLPGEAGPFR